MAISRSAKIIAGGVAGGLVILVIALAVCLPQKDDSIRLEFSPMSRNGSTLIYYNKRDPDSTDSLTDIIDDFLVEYRINRTGGAERGAENRVACDHNVHQLQPNQVCDVPLDSFGSCIKDNKYNYRSQKGGPCVFLKLNKIFNWIPSLYNTSESLPSNMPAALKEYIAQQGKDEANVVWVSCEGESPADVENIGPVNYFPRRGFPAYYYPFTNVEGYLSPLVAVHFEKPNTGILINIECKAWAKNLQNDRVGQHGSVHFELMVDN